MIMKRTTVFLVLLLLTAAGFAGWAVLAARPEEAAAGELVSLVLADDASDFARALEPGAIEFPRDLGAHDQYQTEWWYYTGNLETADGRPFGFQFTIFRRALTADTAAAVAAAGASSWRSNQLYFAHLALSDIGGGEFYADERFSRGAAALAGADADPYRVWLDDWSATAESPGRVRLTAATDEVALNLLLTETGPPVLHGDRGLSQKGPEPGNASYYYSIVQQAVAGRITVGDQVYAVTGRAWKDHEYGTSFLEPGATGWDWFSLQLDDGSALMFFEIRLADGRLSSFSAGSYIDPAGQVTPLALGDWRLEVTDRWTSPHSDADYPAGWRLTIPRLELELTGEPLLADQELNLSTVYWEGASVFQGTKAGQPIIARGYVELTGYAGSMEGRL